MNRIVIVLLPLFAIVGCSDPTTVDDVNVELVDAYPDMPDFDQPVAMVYDATNRRWYVAEREGNVLWFDDDADSSSARTALDFSDSVDSVGANSGLLSIAIPPTFGTAAQLYLSYINDDSELVISRLTSADNGRTFNRLAEEQLLTVPQDPDNDKSHGGNMLFGPDGFLYVGFGDGGEADDDSNPARDNRSLLGKMIRIDPSSATPYAIPADNPFASTSPVLCEDGEGSANCPEIFAWGFRNPWRWSFDATFDTLWLGDVGESSFEEINQVEPGLDYGWNIREGSDCHNPSSGCRSAGFTDPVAEYDHTVGQSVIGGYVYRGTDVDNLNGIYVFADYVTGTVSGLFEDDNGDLEAESLISQTGLSIVSFAEDPDNELYLLDYSGGRIHRIENAD